MNADEIVSMRCDQQDLARFHAYQASLYGVIAFVAFFILQSLFGGTSFTLFWMALYLFATWYAG